MDVKYLIFPNTISVVISHAYAYSIRYMNCVLWILDVCISRIGAASYLLIKFYVNII